MQHFVNIFKITAIMLLMFLLICCKKEGNIIPKKEFTLILSEMYLADQYIEINEKFRAQTDTLILYEGIFNKYGFTYNDYRNSVRYYLRDGDAMYKIHSKVKQILVSSKEEANRLIALENGKIINWWALDSIRQREVNDLWKEPFLRSVKWLTKQSDPIKWNLLKDTIEFDIPSNALWWQNNIKLNTSGNNDTLYPVLFKDYLIATEINKRKEEIKLRKEAEKERKKKEKEEQKERERKEKKFSTLKTK